MPFYIYFIQVFLLKLLINCNNNFKYHEPFKNLFTQGMVCHETYKDKKEIGYIPEEIKKISDKSKVSVGSMFKKKKRS